jgi:hypothetical protein
MKRQVLSFMMMGILSLVFSGCAAKQVSLVQNNQITVAKQDDGKVKILWTDVYQQDGHTWAYGVLEHQGLAMTPVRIHVDIRIEAPDGSVSYETISQDVYVPGHRVGKGIHWKRFKTQLPDTLSAGSRITMTVHSGDCQQPEAKS